MGNGSRLLTPQGDTSITNVNDIGIAMRNIHDMMAQHNQLYKELMNHLSKTRQKAYIVDVDRSTPSNTLLTLPQFQGNIMIVQAIIYSVPSAATLTIGKRVIPISAAGTQALPFAPSGMIVTPEDAITLAISPAGAMFLEIIGEMMPPDDERKIVRA